MEAIVSIRVNRDRRASNGKVKTGCITCKARHLKCDEQLPGCMRCRQTRIPCRGYLPVKKTRRVVRNKGVRRKPHFTKDDVVINDSMALKESHESLREVQALEYFVQKTALAISDCFDGCFWAVQVPQLSESDPALRSALIAVASAHEQLENIGNLLVGRCKPNRKDIEARRLFGLDQYNSAVGRIAAQLCSTTRPLEITLACCILFICFDFLRGDFNTALLHLCNSLQIAKTLKDDPKSISTNRCLKETVLKTFERLSFQLCITHKSSFGTQLDLPSWEAKNANNLEFTNFSSASKSLETISRACFTLVKRLERYHQSSPHLHTSSNLDEERRVYLNALSSWDRKFQALLARTMNKMDAKMQLGIDKMRILYLISLIWIEASLSGTQMEFDLHVDKFETIVTLADSIVSRIVDGVLDNQCGSRYFSFDMGILPAIYFVAIKCRHFTTRRRALFLLRQVSPRCEGMWNSEILAAIAAQVIYLETEDYKPENQTQMCDIRYPAEEKRVIDVIGVTVRNGMRTIHVDKSEAGPSVISLGTRQQTVGFLRRLGSKGNKLGAEYRKIVW